ncbi:hypothetical protein Drose_06930 [Dactylosporangium roseum]|uniref:Uncharacterized protein n=1 Tax=Dactylosporangium roseum TaxID=47989 RepID=A0ABY5ZBB8_9ACTN|nr:hypothetical protein [Dactylosporangium roseum]UWZ37998.1 hypothetical protein Drose_06930 [Dactylosporangium roseum]
MTSKKLLGWAVLALLLYYAATAPADAGHTARDAMSAAAQVGNGLITFLKSATSR